MLLSAGFDSLVGHHSAGGPEKGIFLSILLSSRRIILEYLLDLARSRRLLRPKLIVQLPCKCWSQSQKELLSLLKHVITNDKNETVSECLAFKCSCYMLFCLFQKGGLTSSLLKRVLSVASRCPTWTTTTTLGPLGGLERIPS